jgi:hypothetical protein
MNYAVIAEAYEKIESTTKRLEMTDHLVTLLQQTPKKSSAASSTSHRANSILTLWA